MDSSWAHKVVGDVAFTIEVDRNSLVRTTCKDKQIFIKIPNKTYQGANLQISVYAKTTPQIACFSFILLPCCRTIPRIELIKRVHKVIVLIFLYCEGDFCRRVVVRIEWRSCQNSVYLLFTQKCIIKDSDIAMGTQENELLCTIEYEIIRAVASGLAVL